MPQVQKKNNDSNEDGDVKKTSSDNEIKMIKPNIRAVYVNDDAKILQYLSQNPSQRVMLECFVTRPKADPEIYDLGWHKRELSSYTYASPLAGIKIGVIGTVMRQNMSVMSCFVKDESIVGKRLNYYGRTSKIVNTSHGLAHEVVQERVKKQPVTVVKVSSAEAVDMQLLSSSLTIANRVIEEGATLETTVVTNQFVVKNANEPDMIRMMSDQDWRSVHEFNALEYSKRNFGVLTEAAMFYFVSDGITMNIDDDCFYPWDYGYVQYTHNEEYAKCPVNTVNRIYLLAIHPRPKVSWIRHEVLDAIEIVKCAPLTNMTRVGMNGIFRDCVWYDARPVEYIQIVCKMLRMVGSKGIYGQWSSSIFPWIDIPGYKMVGAHGRAGFDPILKVDLCSTDVESVFIGCKDWAWNPNEGDFGKLTQSEGFIFPIESPHKIGTLVKLYVDLFPNSEKFFFGLTLGSLPCIFVGRTVDRSDRCKSQPEAWIGKGDAPFYASRIANAMFFLAVRNYQLAANMQFQTTMLYPSGKGMVEMLTYSKEGYGFNDYKYGIFMVDAKTREFNYSAAARSDFEFGDVKYTTKIAPPVPFLSESEKRSNEEPTRSAKFKKTDVNMVVVSDAPDAGVSALVHRFDADIVDVNAALAQLSSSNCQTFTAVTDEFQVASPHLFPPDVVFADAE